ncbi:hypothetical protein VP01_3285g1 [Puccinia sorghi]|uniref:Integrase catalytic domain-containing protein n=1 Tax=Puccinia sorghi TaxID=27349 RepID=A0A0L6UXN9_9BASI|nr:hypothetical protein VP01_3285g1 [Puccinia sorghi]
MRLKNPKIRPSIVLYDLKSQFFTKNSFHTKPFEEIHMDIVVDSCTQFCSAIPVRSKGNVAEVIAQAIGLEANRIDFFNQNMICACQSDAYTPQQNGLAERFNWQTLNNTLTLNQIPSHQSKKSPYKLFKGRKLPLDFFKPIGNRVSYLIQPELQHAKLEAKGLLGTLIGFNDELRSYKILGDNGKIVDTSHLKFLDPIKPNKSKSINDSDLIVLSDEDFSSDTIESAPDSEDDMNENESQASNDEEIVSAGLIPSSLRTLFKVNARKSKWFTAENEELENIKGHDVWEDHFEEPNSFFKTSAANPCLFIHKDKSLFIFFHQFPNSSAHNPDTLLGMELTYKANEVTLSQKKLITCWNLRILCCQHSALCWSCRTRPDLAPAVSILSSFNNAPGIDHWKQVIHCWKYLAGSVNLKLTHCPDSSNSSNSLQHFTDAVVIPKDQHVQKNLKMG